MIRTKSYSGRALLVAILMLLLPFFATEALSHGVSYACCDGGGPVGCAQKPACQECVCAQDPWCCLTGWDGLCAVGAAGSCVGVCGCDDHCGDPHGDVNASGSINVADALCVVLAALWATNPGPQSPGCLVGPASVADLNCDGAIDVSDAVWTISQTLLPASAPDSGCPAACVFSPSPACESGIGSPCDDLNRCTLGDICTPNGCAGTPGVCDDGDPCTVDVCDPQQGCTIQGQGGGTSLSGASCLAILNAHPGVPSGVYTISLPGRPSFLAWCDMQTQGGGWTYGAIVTSATPIDNWNRIPGVTPFGDIVCGQMPTEHSVNLEGIQFTSVRIDNFTRGETVLQNSSSTHVWTNTLTQAGSAAQKYKRQSLNASWEFRVGYYAAYCGSGNDAHIPMCFTSPSNPVTWACDTDSGPVLGVLDPTGGELCGGAFYYCKKVWRNGSGQCFSYVSSPMTYGFAVR